VHQKTYKNEREMCLYCGKFHLGVCRYKPKSCLVKNANARYKALYMSVSINGGKFVTGLRDTGSDLVIVDKSLVNDADLLEGESVEVKLACNDSAAELPLAVVKLTSKHFGYYQPVDTIVAVAKGLAMPILLGNSLYVRHPELTDVVTLGAERPLAEGQSTAINRDSDGDAQTAQSITAGKFDATDGARPRQDSTTTGDGKSTPSNKIIDTTHDQLA